MAGKRKSPPTKNPLTARKGPSQATVIGIIVVVAFAAVVGVGVFWNNSSSSSVVPPNATAQGIPTGNPSAAKTVDIYVDFQCPYCKAFTESAAPTLDRLRDSGQAQIVYHPVAFLDRASSTQFSTRSAAAAGCAAAGGVFPKFEELVYANQPPEGGAGLPNEKLIELGQQAGAGGDFAQCVEDQRYAPWTQDITKDATRSGISGTPTIKVNGQDVDPSPQAVEQAVLAG